MAPELLVILDGHIAQPDGELAPLLEDHLEKQWLQRGVQLLNCRTGNTTRQAGVRQAARQPGGQSGAGRAPTNILQ